MVSQPDIADGGGRSMSVDIVNLRRTEPRLYSTRKPYRVHPNFIPMITLNSASGILAMALGAKGLNLTISTACSSSAHAVGQALASIRHGRACAYYRGG